MIPFGQVHLAEALAGAAEFARKRHDGLDQSRALLAEARASLEAAEPILRAAEATGYLERLESARHRVDRAG
jgi:hypothetical protein